MGLGRNAKNQRVCGIKTSRASRWIEIYSRKQVGLGGAVPRPGPAFGSGHLVGCRRLAAGSMGGSCPVSSVHHTDELGLLAMRFTRVP